MSFCFLPSHKRDIKQMYKKKNHELTAMFLVAIVTTIISVIASRTLLDAALRSVASELVQSTGRLQIIFASLLIPAVPAVQVTIAFLLFGYAKFWCGPDAPEVVRLALSVRYNRRRVFVTSYPILLISLNFIVVCNRGHTHANNRKTAFNA